MEQSESRARVWLWRVWLLIGVGVVVVALYRVFRAPLELIVPPLALASVIVYLLNPTVRWLSGRGLSRGLATLLAYVVMIAFLVGIVAVVGPLIGEQIRDLVDEAPAIAASVQRTVNDVLARAGLSQRILIDPQNPETQAAVEQFIADNREQLLGFVRGAGTVVTRVFHVVLTFVLAPILAFYFLADLPSVRDGLRRLIPPSRRDEVADMVIRIGGTVGAYFRGQLLVAAFVAVATSLALALVGLPFWAVVGALAGVFNLIPLIGPFVGGAVGVVIALTVGGGLGQAVAVVIAMTVVQQVDNHLITPNIMSRTVHVHPVTVIIGLTAAGAMFGILGMLVAIPFIATVKLLTIYLLVTRVPSMQHLAGTGPGLFDGVVREPPEGTLIALGREMRSAFDRRRREAGRMAGRAREAEPPNERRRATEPAARRGSDPAARRGSEPPATRPAGTGPSAERPAEGAAVGGDTAEGERPPDD